MRIIHSDHNTMIAFALFLLVVTLLALPTGEYLYRVLVVGATPMPARFQRIEGHIFRFCGVDAEHEMGWAEYARAFIWFSLAGTMLLYALLRVQHLLPASNGASLSTALTPDLSANTAISFSTTTTWQAYAGESTMAYGSQLMGLAVQNFLAGASGLAVGIAFIRGLAREQRNTLGNFWVDVIRSTMWVLLPLSLVGGLVLVAQGVPMTFDAYPVVHTLDGATQTIASGPVAALEIIKQLGTNGGGFFNANGAHPLENPTPQSNFVELLCIALLPIALVFTFGRTIGKPRDSWVLYGVMVAVFAASVAIGSWAEHAGTPALQSATSIAESPSSAGGNMEGKELRFGVTGSVLAAAVTSGGATGSYNAMHDSFTPIGGAVPLVNMLLGEISFGGLGTGLISILVVAVLGLFITGLMIGRTPEYLGKAIGAVEIQYIMLYMLIAPVAVLVPAAIAVVEPAGLAGLTVNHGAHGLSEILFAYATSFGNNGQNFAGLNTNTPFYNVSIAIAMMLGRFALIVPALAFAGRMGTAKRRTHSAGMPTDTGLFAAVVLMTAVVAGALTFLPALAVGPLAEHFTMRAL